MFYLKPLPFNYFKLKKSLIYRSISGLNIWNEDLTPEIKHKIENHWRNKLPVEKYNEKSNKEKYYVLSMFPYPSGHLHMGHVRVYTISDSVARFQKMNGKNVIHPIGWDAFGLPAENAAVERNVAASDWTYENIKYMKEQLKQLGTSFEWDRELATCDPKYYKWTQELFLKLYDAGLVYQKQAEVNWDPIDQTVLADEQVDENGKSWRSGAKVEKKSLRQWFVKTRKFAKSLLDGLDDPSLKDWRDITKLQKHWIGECNGISLDFSLVGRKDDFLSMWSDKPEYMEHAAFIAVRKASQFGASAGSDLDASTRLLDLKAVNPLNGKEIPILATDSLEYQESCDTYLGIPMVNSADKQFADNFNLSYERNGEPDIDKAKSKGFVSSAKLRDWLISRQRYWGTPIPIIHCDKCGPQPVPREQLPVKLPVSTSTTKTGSLLAQNEEWLKTECPKCGGAAKRESDTMDTFVDSTWYFLRYLNPNYEKDMFDVERAKTMFPVDLYIGGKEHAVLHLYYARFISHFLHSLGLLPEREPFKRLLVQGMVMGRSFRVKGTGQYLHESMVNIINVKKNKAEKKETGEPVTMQWEKMSKSKHNGVDPSDMFKEYGVDTTRLLILADVAPTSHRNWNSNTFPGILGWQRRLWLTVGDFIKHRTAMPEISSQDEFRAQEDYMFDSRNYYVKGATFNYCDSQQISVAISKMQGLTNSLRRAPPSVFARGHQFERALACQIILLAPIAPHFASELWSGFLSAPNRLNQSNEIDWNANILKQTWPDIDYEYNLDLVFQVNGCENAVMKFPRKEIEMLCKDEAIALAFEQKEVQETLKRRTVLDVQYVMHKGYESVVNIITTNPPPKNGQKNEMVGEIS
ncbi:PREDICTED: probable leucine--tRNA ligase, mitochondrial [Nicrophorus vespilloides]|uniref:leucine--tRNA ligase n=1 Tax=Nicrophorus vespilloides TaxID=110193 RepID=A0ABM1MTC4_NICVS|nr:PREDICTED: probable leucine--tRNA ligase, mitochondrial [Nicrophorus vespilloides]